MHIVSPTEYTRNPQSSSKTLFLAGGITDCPNWQDPAAELLLERTTLTVFNPRRANWNMDKAEEESRKQILWEHRHLQYADIIVFWFPMETLCPITLFELGKYLMTDKELIVGTHPEYQRRLDVIVQSRLERPNLKIWSNLDDMIHTFIRDHKIGL